VPAHPDWRVNARGREIRGRRPAATAPRRVADSPIRELLVTSSVLVGEEKRRSLGGEDAISSG
jgi:hypothetical protein